MESVVQAQPVSDKEFALDGIYTIGGLLGFDKKELLKAEVLRALITNTRPSLLARDVMTLCVKAAKDYALERKNGTKVLTSWRNYALNVADRPLRALNDVYDLASARVMITACSLGIYPYTVDTGGGGIADLRAMIRGALESILEPNAIKVFRYNPASGEEMKKFYDMKKHQTLDDLRIIDPSLPEGMCPLLSKYRLGVYLGGGTYGVVLKVTAGSSTSKLGYDEYALKIQAIIDENDSVSTAYNELKISDLVMQGLPRVNLGSRITNVVKMYDWVKCKLDLKETLSKLPGKYDDVFVHNGIYRDGFDGKNTFQFMVSEFADGNCYKLMSDSPRTCFNGEFMRSFLSQILCSLSQLQDRHKFVHFDLHLMNVLYQLIPPSDIPEYLHYSIRGKNMYVSLDLTGGRVFKLADFGMAYAQYYADDEPVPRIVAGAAWYMAREARGDKFNPRFDMHELACSILERLFFAVRKGVVDASSIDPRLLTTLMFMVNSQWKDMENQRAYKIVSKAVDILDKARTEKNPSGFITSSPNRDDISRAGEQAMILRAQIFDVTEEPSSWITTVLSYKFFDQCYSVPQKSAHLIDMDLLGTREVTPRLEPLMTRDRYGNIFEAYEPPEDVEAPEELPESNVPDEVMELCDWNEVVKGVWICSEDPVNEEHGNYATCMERNTVYGYKMPKFKAILNAAPQDVRRPRKFNGEYYSIPEPFQDLPFGPGWKEREFIEKVSHAARVIDGWVKAGITPILVHCVAGQNRSVAVMIAYLMKYRGWTFDQAFARMIYVNANRFDKKALTQTPFIWALKLDFVQTIRK